MPPACNPGVAGPILSRYTELLMRPFISCITTLATVMHLAFGCCLHATHVGAASECWPADALAAHECDGDHDHGCDHGHAGACVNAPVESPDAVAGTHPAMAGADVAHHDCPGCRCMAMTELKRPFDQGDSEGRPAIVCVDGLPPSLPARADLPSLASLPVLSALKPPLFERLSI